MKNIKGHNFFKKESLIKKDINKPLMIGKYKEDIHYKVIGVPENKSECKDSPKIGDSLVIKHYFLPCDFHKAHYSTEQLFVSVIREETYVFIQTYFETVEELKQYLDKYSLELDKNYATDKILNLNKEFKEICEKYSNKMCEVVKEYDL